MGRKGRKIARPEDAEHISEIGACTHADVFDNIRKNLPSLDDALLKDEKAFLEEYDVGGFLGNVGGRVDGYPHVGCLKAGASFMPSPIKPTTWPLLAQSPNDFLFLGRRELHEHVGFQDGSGKLFR